MHKTIYITLYRKHNYKQHNVESRRTIADQRQYNRQQDSDNRTTEKPIHTMYVMSFRQYIVRCPQHVEKKMQTDYRKQI